MTVGSDKFQLTGAELGGSIRHHGWTIAVDPAATLAWPVFPHNPYIMVC